MRSRRIGQLLLIFAISLAGLGPMLRGVAPPAGAPERTEVYLTREVRHRLVMLPYYSISGWLEYRISGYDVVLMGYVVRPSLKSEASNVVKGIESVQSQGK